jgi:hypothetical protein
VLLVAAIAATVSDLHVYRLAVQLGQPELAAWLMPLSVDGAVGAASIALLAAARAGDRSPATARVMLALGVLATLTANAYSGAGHGIAGMALAMWPGVAFVGSAETALSMVRKSARASEAPAPAGAESAPLEALTVPARPALSLAWPRPAVVKPAPAVRTRTAPKTRTRSAPVTVESAALRYADDAALGNFPSMRRVRSDLHVGQARAQAIVAHLRALSQEGIAA